jgi:UDP-N-acetylmuramoyl-tripeptide--D-alanyl-D-alanine ligase
MRISMDNAIRWMGAEGRRAGYGGSIVEGWSIDSRTVEAGDIFFALRGTAHDGHDFVSQALARRGTPVVDRELPSDVSALRVDDTLRAMQRLANHARRSWGGKLVGVTGSAGKTTTKDVIAHFLSTAIPTGKTIGNFNNGIGLPLSILRLPDTCRVAVLEMGMNHAGEIRDLCDIAEPDIAVVTNVGYAHVEFFRSIEEIALAKRELVEALPASGVAVLNADDKFVSGFRGIHRGRTITYGFTEGADIRGENLELLPEGTRFNCNGVPLEASLTGRHGALNVLAGIATAAAFDIGVAELVDAARSIPVGKMRGERLTHNGVTILNDAYNSNPEAARAMLDVLASITAQKHLAVLGEMRELGAQSEKLHRSVGDYAAQKKIDLLIGIGGAARAMLDEAVRAGMPSTATLFFEDPAEAGAALRLLVKPGDAVLFKGSRGVRVERALEKLMEAAG